MTEPKLLTPAHEAVIAAARDFADHTAYNGALATALRSKILALDASLKPGSVDVAMREAVKHGWGDCETNRKALRAVLAAVKAAGL